jgi:hypothetical protein
MTPPIWLDAHGRRRPTRACWTCGREVAPMRLRAADLRPPGWASAPDALDPGLVRVQHGVPAGADWRRLVAAGPDLGPRPEPNPWRRFEPAVPYWAKDP